MVLGDLLRLDLVLSSCFTAIRNEKSRRHCRILLLKAFGSQRTRLMRIDR